MSIADTHRPRHTTGLYNGKLLQGAEWMAENAYIPPGMHRLLSAFGLTAGLWAGRQMMDIITAHNTADGTEITREQVPEPLRPLHGIMRYNPYSDKASDRWLNVIDAIAPVVLGAFGAYIGSKHFFDKTMGGKPLHGLSASVIKQRANQGGKVTLDIADSLMSKQQSDALSKLATSTFVIGSTAGTQLTGALNPLNNGMVAARFQQGNLRNINLPLPRVIRKPIERLLGNHGHTSRRLVPAIRDWVKWAEANIVHNPGTEWRNEKEIIKRADDLLQIFPHLSEAEKKAFHQQCSHVLDKVTAHMHELQKQGKTVGDIETALYQFAHKQISGEGLETLYQNAGIDLRKAQLPDFGPFTAISRLFGSGKEESKTLHALHQQWAQKTGPHAIDTSGLTTAIKTNKTSIAMALGAAGATTAAGSAFAFAARSNRKERERARQEDVHYEPGKAPPRHEQAAIQRSKEKEEHNITSWLNGKPLDAMQWVSRVLITPPSMHRFMSAAYLTGGLWLGMQVANAMTGRHLPNIRSGESARSLLTKDQMAKWNPLRLIHGSLRYTPGLSTTQDRWRQVAHHMIPVGVGAIGTYTGSKMFFSDRERKLENPEFLEDYADAISYQQSKPFAWMTAITSIFNTGSGIHILPVFNYSANLHDRFLLANGQQIAFPVIGQIWSGNPGTLPWGAKRTLRYTINYLSNNPAEHPRELPELVRTVIAKLYPSLSVQEIASKENALVDIIYKVRDPFLHEGIIPPSQRPALKEALTQALTKEGLEQNLTSIGLDVTKAELGSNGFSGTLANTLGQAQAVHRLENGFRQKANARLEHKKAPLPAPPPPHRPANGTPIAENAPTFRDRIRLERDNDHAASATPAL